MSWSVLLSLLLVLSPALSLEVEKPIKEEKAQLLGRWNTLSLDSEITKALTGFVERWYSRQSDSEYIYKAEVINARMQVINGFRYVVEEIMKPTVCLKSENMKPENCQVPDSVELQVERCVFSVLKIVPDFNLVVSAHQCVPVKM